MQMNARLAIRLSQLVESHHEMQNSEEELEEHFPDGRRPVFIVHSILHTHVFKPLRGDERRMHAPLVAFEQNDHSDGVEIATRSRLDHTTIVDHIDEFARLRDGSLVSENLTILRCHRAP